MNFVESFLGFQKATSMITVVHDSSMLTSSQSKPRAFYVFWVNTKNFFMLFWSSMTVSVVIGMAFTSFFAYFVKGYGLPTTLAIVFFSCITGTTLVLKKTHGFSYSIFWKPLVFFCQTDRFIFYWNVIGYTLSFAGVLIKTLNTARSFGFFTSIYVAVVLVSQLLVFRNLIILFTHGIKFVRLDWIFMVLFFAIPVYAYKAFALLGAPVAFSPNIIGLAVFPLMSKLGEKVMEGIGVGLGTAAVGVVVAELPRVTEVLVETLTQDAREKATQTGFEAGFRAGQMAHELETASARASSLTGENQQTKTS